MDFPSDLEKMLSTVSKPARYLGLERNSKIKKFPGNSVKIVLAFPEEYDLGIYFYPFKEIYHKLNLSAGIFAERFYSVGDDLQEISIENSIPALTIETRSALKDSPIIFFPVLNALQMKNVLRTLEFAKIPLKSSDRTENDPIVICWASFSNPLPLQEFADCFLVSETPLSFLQLSDTIKERSKISRAETLEILKNLNGIWAKNSDFTPLESETENDEFFNESKELQTLIDIEFGKQKFQKFRFLTQGCTFSKISEYFSKDGVFSLKSIANGILPSYDFDGFKEIVENSRGFLASGNSQLILDYKRDTKKFGLNFGIITASEKLRTALNLPSLTREFYDILRYSIDNKWIHLNFYFFYCLPSETNKELEENARLLNNILEVCELQKDITLEAHFVPFIPNPNTVFQWYEVPKTETLKEKSEFLQSKIFKSEKLNLTFGNWHEHLIEAALLRSSNGDLLEKIDSRNLLEWFENNANSLEEELSEKSFEKEFGWEVFSKIPKRDLVKQLQKFYTGESDSEFPFSRLSSRKNETSFSQSILKKKKRKVLESSYGVRVKRVASTRPQIGIFTRYRLCYEKLGQAKFLGNQDLARVFENTFAEVKVGLSFTQGHLPTAKLSFGPLLPQGIESLGEYVDFDFATSTDFSEINKVNGKLPSGLKIISGKPITAKFPSVGSQVNSFTYAFIFNSAKIEEDLIKRILEKEEILVKRIKKDAETEINVRPFIKSLEWFPEKLVVEIGIDEMRRSIRFAELLELLELLNLEENFQNSIKVQRIGQFVEHNGQKLTPLEII
ncbi:MAG: DUF2344 domain-containing protein [Calditrichaeota bacterium]|nr:MAG: DUF2344 domain-containing protein [Calditrichota bacterium]